jgi:hypothetical protein
MALSVLNAAIILTANLRLDKSYNAIVATIRLL